MKIGFFGLLQLIFITLKLIDKEEMDEFVWTKGIVRDDVYELEFSVYVDELQDYFAFPYFVLEKI